MEEHIEIRTTSRRLVKFDKPHLGITHKIISFRPENGIVNIYKAAAEHLKVEDKSGVMFSLFSNKAYIYTEEVTHGTFILRAYGNSKYNLRFLNKNLVHVLCRVMDVDVNKKGMVYLALSHHPDEKGRYELSKLDDKSV